MIANSAHEYEVLYMNNLHVSGNGIETLTQHFPCPFCASAEWYAVRLLEFGEKSESVECKACGRSARFIFASEDGVKTVRLVQTGGPDPPHWLNPPPPREGGS